MNDDLRLLKEFRSEISSPDRVVVARIRARVLGHGTRERAHATDPMRTRRSKRSRIGMGRRASRRGLLIAIAVTAAMIVIGSSLAISAGKNWYFIGGGGPNASDVVVVTTGTWDGHDWNLAAYRNQDGEVCFAVTRGSSPTEFGPQGSAGCSRFTSGGAVGKLVFPTLKNEITGLWMTGQFNPDAVGLGAYFAGAVIDKATSVRIKLANGSTIETETIAAPTALDLPIRFFVTALPSDVEVLQVTATDDQDAPVAQANFPPS